MFRIIDHFVRQRSFTRFAHVPAEFVHDRAHAERRLSLAARCLGCQHSGRNRRGCKRQPDEFKQIAPRQNCPAAPCHLIFASPAHHVRSSPPGALRGTAVARGRPDTADPTAPFKLCHEPIQIPEISINSLLARRNTLRSIRMELNRKLSNKRFFGGWATGSPEHYFRIPRNPSSLVHCKHLILSTG